MGIIVDSVQKNGNRLYKVTSAASVLPVTVAELKTFARIDSSYEDTLLTEFITLATDACERYIGRALIEQSITMYMDYLPDYIIDIPKVPVISITTVKVLYEDGTSETISSTNYYLVQGENECKLCFKSGINLPIGTDKIKGGYEFIYKAGYGAASTNVPALILVAIKMWAAEMYDSRVPSTQPSPAVAKLLERYRIPVI